MSPRSVVLFVAPMGILWLVMAGALSMPCRDPISVYLNTVCDDFAITADVGACFHVQPRYVHDEQCQRVCFDVTGVSCVTWRVNGRPPPSDSLSSPGSLCLNPDDLVGGETNVVCRSGNFRNIFLRVVINGKCYSACMSDVRVHIYTLLPNSSMLT